VEIIEDVHDFINKRLQFKNNPNQMIVYLLFYTRSDEELVLQSLSNENKGPNNPTDSENEEDDEDKLLNNFLNNKKFENMHVNTTNVNEVEEEITPGQKKYNFIKPTSNRNELKSQNSTSSIKSVSFKDFTGEEDGEESQLISGGMSFNL
jgi:hypothetical protein